MSQSETGLLAPEGVATQQPVAQTAALTCLMRSIPFRLAVTIPVSGLKLRSLRELRVGQLFTTDISAGEDVPVRAGGSPFGYAELDNVDGVMAVRMTRLS